MASIWDWNAFLSAVPPTMVSLLTLLLMWRVNRQVDALVAVLKRDRLDDDLHTTGHRRTRAADHAPESAA